MAQQIAITSRTRSLGCGWTNSVERVWNSDYTHDHLAVREPGEQLRGSLKDIEAERASAARGNNANDWREALFVGGKPVRLAEYGSVADALRTLRETGSIIVEVPDAAGE